MQNKNPFSKMPGTKTTMRQLTDNGPINIMDDPVSRSMKKPSGPMSHLRSNFRPSSLKSAGLLGGMAMSGAGFGLSVLSSLSSMSKRKTVTAMSQTPRIYTPGSKNLGVDPMAGVRFSTNRRKPGRF